MTPAAQFRLDPRLVQVTFVMFFVVLVVVTSVATVLLLLPLLAGPWFFKRWALSVPDQPPPRASAIKLGIVGGCVGVVLILIGVNFMPALAAWLLAITGMNTIFCNEIRIGYCPHQPGLPFPGWFMGETVWTSLRWLCLQTLIGVIAIAVGYPPVLLHLAAFSACGAMTATSVLLRDTFRAGLPIHTVAPS